MKKMVREHVAKHRQITACIGAVLLLALSGCAAANNSGGPVNPNLPVGLPPTPPPASSNGFAGTQSPGLWSVTIDDTQEQFSYQALTYPAAPNVATTGTFLPIEGFYSLTGSTGMPAGYAVEVPGRAVVLQPGADTTAPVIAVEQDSCFSINGTVRFQFVEVPDQFLDADGVQVAGIAYGFVNAETSADGASWLFGGQAVYTLPYTLGAPGIGSPVPPGNAAIPGQGTFNATCSVTNGQAAILAAPNVTSPPPGGGQAPTTLPTTFVIGPTGFFVEDQSGSQSQIIDAAPSFAGMVQPSAPLTTSSVAAAQYVGFLREAGSGVAGATPMTRPIGFGQIVAGSGTSLTGGTFLNDDITQFQNSNIVVNLGAQDPQNNGLYTSASVTVPDPNNVCFIDPSTGHNGAGGTPGVNQFGNETCTFNAVAVVGNPENKYAIFIRSWDVTTHLAMGMYLFQQ